jgi:hypothetical protein
VAQIQNVAARLLIQLKLVAEICLDQVRALQAYKQSRSSFQKEKRKKAIKIRDAALQIYNDLCEFSKMVK